MAHTFNPNEFFHSTAFYPSAARGEFILTKVPVVLERLRVTSRVVDLGVGLLQSGLMAYGLSMPSQYIQAVEGFGYNGPTRKIPQNLTYTDVEVSFYMMGATRDEASSLLVTLSMWQEQIAGFRKLGSPQVRYDGTSYTSTFFSSEYYDNVIGEAATNLYHPISPTVPINSIRYFEVYPLTLGNMTTDWTNEDKPVTLPVTFTYHYSTPIAPIDRVPTVSPNLT